MIVLPPPKSEPLPVSWCHVAVLKAGAEGADGKRLSVVMIQAPLVVVDSTVTDCHCASVRDAAPPLMLVPAVSVAVFAELSRRRTLNRRPAVVVAGSVRMTLAEVASMVWAEADARVSVALDVCTVLLKIGVVVDWFLIRHTPVVDVEVTVTESPTVGRVKVCTPLIVLLAPASTVTRLATTLSTLMNVNS